MKLCDNRMMKSATLTALASLFTATVQTGDASTCPGYVAHNVEKSDSKITADLKLNGKACNIYGEDLPELKLLVEHQTAKRLHVKIFDAAEQVYQIPRDVFSVPEGTSSGPADLAFNLQENPFSFAITRNSNNETLFNTTGQALVFESQYIRMRTSLPENANIYGLGESADPFRHDPTNYSHAIWTSGQPFMPPNSNMYGAHPVYYDHRGEKGSHAVYLHNSNGLRVNLGVDSEPYLEYNGLGGVFDMFFLSGPTPKDLSMQYAAVVGLPAMMPYWSFGFHQCRYGYQDAYETAAVVANYSAADIPLETIWNDIDYMDYRSTFSLDPIRFRLPLMQDLIKYLRDHNQYYIMMVDPAVASRDYKPFHDGVAKDAFMKHPDGSLFTGVVWPGPTNFPDWFAPNTQAFWDQQFDTFFNPQSGVDIDGLWIDMNEPSNFCDYPCTDPVKSGIENRDPPRPPPARMYSPYKIPGFPDAFQPHCMAIVTFVVDAQTGDGEDLLLLGNTLAMGNNVPYHAPQMNGQSGNFSLTVQLPANTNCVYSYPRYTHEGQYIYEAKNRTIKTGGCGSFKTVEDHWTPGNSSMISSKRATDYFQARDIITRGASASSEDAPMSGLPGRELLSPPYDIKPFFGTLSGQSMPTNLYHANGLVEYDVHSLYGSMMGATSRRSLLKRRPGKRPLIITRSQYAGDGRSVGHWFGDNESTDDHYRLSITQMIQFPSMFQIPMVGSDVCGFNFNTNPTLCARWAVLGAWNPFYRNHAERSSIFQEFYRWDNVAEAARAAIATRYRLLDYMYTNMHRQTKTGFPMLTPLLWEYPHDTKTYDIELQFFHGPALMVSPVTSPNSTSVSFYVPNDVFYDFTTHEKIVGTGAMMSRDNIGLSEIPVFIRGGNVLPMRVRSANTTTAVRKEDFELIIAPDANDKAVGDLYLDDGESLEPAQTSMLHFTYEHGRLDMNGTFGYNPGVKIAKVTLLGIPNCRPFTTRVNLSLNGRFTLAMAKSCSS